ncbi:DNA-binding transcriptional LysR family regulator [Azomonas agilis]|uniref:DNA-binding transcriptional LysR family regulator n=1 Tax=Azomonas agilis TaxID=116849 RepID=A0A562IY47_9GAMM|nr:LysR family transcriptional regulator [Azomonas agilis]TWH75981.1 DNA-binding transcriptional LysR family regulator [Azomonas agilis]
MKLDDIAAFMSAVRCQSIIHAAESLQLTQPAITRRIQNLEQDLGVELLDRNTKPLKPTAIGLRVYEQCRAIVREMDNLRELVARDTPPSGSLRLGIPQTLGDVLLPNTFEQLKQVYPDLQTQVVTGWGSNLMGKLEKGELDAATALFPAGKVFPEGVLGEALGSMNLLVVCAQDMAFKRTGKLMDYYRQGWILNPDGCGFRASLHRTLLEQGLELRVNLETFGIELQLSLVAQGVGLGLVPEPLLKRSMHRERLSVVQLRDFKPVIDLWLLQPRFLGNLQGAVDLFKDQVASSLSLPTLVA